IAHKQREPGAGGSRLSKPFGKRKVLADDLLYTIGFPSQAAGRSVFPVLGLRGTRTPSLFVYLRGGLTMLGHDFLRDALARASEGWAVHPLYGILRGRCECGGTDCKPGKHPRLIGWQEKASRDPGQIRAWWHRWPHSNIGGATGRPSGVNVVDVDPTHRGGPT